MTKNHSGLELEKLIELCGDDFRWLKYLRHQKTFLAQGRPHPIRGKDIKVVAKTAKEAVEGLLLELGKKD